MKILLSSVFGPYGVDDEYGRKENIMELMHNQVTREQGVFSLRLFHQSYGLHFIAENISVPTVVLDFPSQGRFIREILKGYDYVGISFIVPNLEKTRRMAELVRKHAPRSKIVVGGHGTAISGVENLIEHDYICRGEGVSWFRQLLGEETERPFRHPDVPAAFARRIMGMPLRTEGATLIPGVGCPNACRFCCTSHFFGKKYIPFFDSGEKLFDVCKGIEKRRGYTNFFVMDENFLKRPERAQTLLRLMEQEDKLYKFGIFSSAETISQVGEEFLARLGVTFLWIGVESKLDIYEKNKGISLKPMLRKLREHGVSVLASGILFLEHHDHQTIWDDIRFMVDMDSDFVQFMQLGPEPGTRLYEDYEQKGILRKDIPFEEWHGQHRLWFDHSEFTPEESESILRQAFRYDYDTRGSSLLRHLETTLMAAENLARYSDPILQKRAVQFRAQAKKYRPVLPAMRKHAHNAHVRSLTDRLIGEYERVLGPMSVGQKLASRVVRVYAAREAARVATNTNVYQPRMIQTKYRMSVRELMSSRLEGKSLKNLLSLNIDWGQSYVLVRLGGVMDRKNAKILAWKLRHHLSRKKEELIINLDQLLAIEDGALKRFLLRIKKHHEQVTISIGEASRAVRDVVTGLPDELSGLFLKKGMQSAQAPTS